MNFKLIGGVGIAEKQLKQRNISVEKIIDKYYDVGIREFFVGYNPSYWHDKYGFEFSPNGRFGENEQITTYKTLKKSIEYIHSLDNGDGKPCKAFITVNGWYYSEKTMPLVQKMIKEFEKIGVDGLIVSNFEALEYLADIGYEGEIHTSTIWSMFNEDALEFLIDYCKESNLNLTRLILPREMALSEIERICNKFPNQSFEVFGHGDYCRYSNGLCFAEHKYFSRDLCTFVLNRGLEVKKSIKYDYKDVLLDKNKDKIKKQSYIDNSLDDLEDIFVSQNVVDANSSETKLDSIINKLSRDINSMNKKKLKKIYKILANDVINNFHKYIWDGYRDENDLHNMYIDKVLTLYQLLLKADIKPADKVKNQISKIQKLKQKAMKYFEDLRDKLGKYGIESYYKFMLYNRTSVPLYHFFDKIDNVDVVKLPTRGRDLDLFDMGLDTIQKAISNPKDFLDAGNISGRYFHYDMSNLDVYKSKLNELCN